MCEYYLIVRPVAVRAVISLLAHPREQSYIIKIG